ncbi:MAG: hypothetical protein WB622_18690 [Acidobacteriaceae bacterium]|jgi:hypothetical protein
MPTRSFNVYSEKVVVYPNETFYWFANASALENGNVSVQSSDWPLSPAAPVLTSQSPSVSVTVSNEAGAPSSYTFSCTPTDSDVTTQTLIIARQYVSNLCNDVEIYAGDHFIWHNTGSLAVTIKPDTDNPENWPLSQAQYDLAPGDWVAVEVPSDAEAFPPGYILDIVYSNGSQPCQDLATQPKLVVGGGPVPAAKPGK